MAVRVLLLLIATGSLVPPAVGLEGIHQFQPCSDRTAVPPILRNEIHLRHCMSNAFVTRYETSGPKDDL